MNQVLKSILERKGKTVPVNDGRRISLVLHGGLMSGISSAGSLKALQEMGLGKVFDDIYVISAGFPNACYFLTEDGRKGGSKGMSIYYEDLVSKNFINYLRFWKVVDIEKLMSVMKSDKKLDLETLFNSHSNLYAALWDIKGKRIEYIELKKFSRDQFQKLLQASMSIPFFYPGSVEIDGRKYKDALLLWGAQKDIYYKHAIYPLSQGATDVLVVNNYHDQLKTHGLPNNIYVINPPAGLKISKFETDKDKLIATAKAAGEFTKKEFGMSGTIEML
ncbi:MAG: hypothetical protein NUV78_03330 [Candidatus Zambryskibacteria bacterium]|nr:hypothetical protein [Candidatus Zambryskibacteria bacterium]